jgi:pyridoxine 5-phosphate synthase
MTKLSVNVNKVATLRNTRNLGIPSVSEAAQICLQNGAHGITVHPRPDERHIRPHDVYEIAELLRSFPRAEFNIEGNPFHRYMDFARDVRPTQCTLVPDSPESFTSNQGWQLSKDAAELEPIVRKLHDFGCRVSLFMDATSEELHVAKEIGADRVELYTEPFAAGYDRGDEQFALASYVESAEKARQLSLGLNAGHDLNRDNLPCLLGAIPDILEVSIGHALIADALKFGLAETVGLYLQALQGPAA